MRSIKYARRAITDLEEITDYTAQNWGSKQAKTYIRGIRTRIEEIARGEAVAQPMDGVNDKLFKLRVQRHMIIYEETSQAVFILRILHEAMDVPRHIP